jgi:hypothetical protein
MDEGYKKIKSILDETIQAERECGELIHSLLQKETQYLHNPIIDRIVSILKDWSNKPPADTLKELKKIQECEFQKS